MINRFISVILTVLTITPPAVAVADIFIKHELARQSRASRVSCDIEETRPQMDALRSCDEAVVVNEEIPAENGTASVVQLCEGVGRVKPTSAYNATEDELEQLVTLCYLEAGGESDAVIRSIVNVVFNRLASGIWGETLTDVIFAPCEFDPAPYIADFETGGNLIIEDKLDEIRDVVWDVYMNGSTIPERVMFFRTDYYHAWEGAVDEFAVGNVYFSSSRWCDGTY